MRHRQSQREQTNSKKHIFERQIAINHVLLLYFTLMSVACSQTNVGEERKAYFDKGTASANDYRAFASGIDIAYCDFDKSMQTLDDGIARYCQVIAGSGKSATRSGRMISLTSVISV